MGGREYKIIIFLSRSGLNLYLQDKAKHSHNYSRDSEDLIRIYAFSCQVSYICNKSLTYISGTSIYSSKIISSYFQTFLRESKDERKIDYFYFIMFSKKPLENCNFYIFWRFFIEFSPDNQKSLPVPKFAIFDPL